MSPIVWHDFSSNGDDIQLRPQYMQPLAGKEEVEVGDGREGDKQVDMDLMHKQNLLSDIWGGLRVIQENNLLTEQMVEAIACFVAIALDMSATDVVLKGESGEMLTQLGRVPTEKLEQLRIIIFQHVGLRGRVLSEFYLSTQEGDEGHLAMVMGFEKDDADDKVLRYSPAAFDLMKQQVLEQKTQELMGQAQQEGNNVSRQKSSTSRATSLDTTHDSTLVPHVAEEETELMAETAVLEEMYNPYFQTSVDSSTEDARSDASVSQYTKNLDLCKDALIMLQGDLDERAHLQQVIQTVTEELRELQPQLHLLQANTEEAAKIAHPQIVNTVVQRMRASDDLLKSKLEKWSIERFKERIKFHDALIQELEHNMEEIEKEVGEIQQANANEKGAFRPSAAPQDVQETLQQLTTDREVYFTRLKNHTRHKTHAKQQYQIFQTSHRCATDNPVYDDVRLAARLKLEAEEDVALIAGSFEFPDPSGALPGMVTRLHESLVNRLVALRQAVLDISAHAEALLVKARQNVVTCLALSMHRPPVQLQVFIRELVCDGLERFMKEQKAKDAQEQEAKLLQLLEEESNLQKAKEEKEKKKKTKSKAKKAKKKDVIKPEVGDVATVENGVAKAEEEEAAGGEAGVEDGAEMEVAAMGKGTEVEAVEVWKVGKVEAVKLLENCDGGLDGGEKLAPVEVEVRPEEDLPVEAMLEGLIVRGGGAEVESEEWTAPAARRHRQRSERGGEAASTSSTERYLPVRHGDRKSVV